jgi:hypothetical protein
VLAGRLTSRTCVVVTAERRPAERARSSARAKDVVLVAEPGGARSSRGDPRAARRPPAPAGDRRPTAQDCRAAAGRRRRCPRHRGGRLPGHPGGVPGPRPPRARQHRTSPGSRSAPAIVDAEAVPTLYSGRVRPRHVLLALLVCVIAGRGGDRRPPRSARSGPQDAWTGWATRSPTSGGPLVIRRLHRHVRRDRDGHGRGHRARRRPAQPTSAGPRRRRPRPGPTGRGSQDEARAASPRRSPPGSRRACTPAGSTVTRSRSSRCRAPTQRSSSRRHGRGPGGRHQVIGTYGLRRPPGRPGGEDARGHPRAPARRAARHRRG